MLVRWLWYGTLHHNTTQQASHPPMYRVTMAQLVGLVCMAYLLEALLCQCVVFVVLTLVPLMKRCIVLSFEKKWEIIEEVEARWTITHLAQACTVPTNTLYN